MSKLQKWGACILIIMLYSLVTALILISYWNGEKRQDERIEECVSMGIKEVKCVYWID